MADCFYYDTPMLSRDEWDGIGVTANLETIDHVFPLLAARRMAGMPFLTDAWRLLNRVPCCDRCNQRKGDMAPVKWLSNIPDAGQHRLAEGLAQIGALLDRSIRLSL